MAHPIRLHDTALLVALLAVTLAGCGGGKAAPGSDCDAPRGMCGDTCVELQTDATNCGVCGVSCGSEACVDGVCQCGSVACPLGASCVDAVCVCPPGQVNCGDVCADLAGDEDHCGACRNECGVNGTCVSGLCECDPVQCTAGQVLCLDGQCDYCTDLSSDSENCGACANRCPDNSTCVSGICQCNPVSCSGSEVVCLSGACQVCVDLSSDLKNCGACGNACDPDVGVCVSGACMCPGSLVMAAGRCRDYTSDPNHCGGMGNGCRDSEYCASGVCQCRPGLADCGGGQCVDLTSNDDHCGGCNVACTGGTDFCINGTCQSANNCPGGTQECDPNGESCVPDQAMQQSNLHCGGCNDRCDQDQVCGAGSCHDYHVGRLCTSCPCGDCAATERCCTLPGTTTIVCVEGVAACPN